MGKKIFFLYFFLIFLFSHLQAKDFNSSLKFGLGSLSMDAIALDNVHFQIGYGFEINPFRGDVMMQVANKSIALATDASYRFLNFKRFKAFAHGLFCIEFVPDEKISTDTFGGVSFLWGGGGVFSVYTDFLGGIKTSNIFAMPNIPAIINADFAFLTNFNWKILNATNIFFSLASYEIFYHPIFFAPIWTLGVNHLFMEKILFATEVAIRTIDLFTLSSYIEGFSVRLKMECKLK